MTNRAARQAQPPQFDERPFDDSVNPQRASLIVDAEESVLSAMLMEVAAIAEVRAVGVQPDDFADRGRARVFVALLALEERGIAIDPLTLSAELNGSLEGIGGKDYIGFLVDVVPTAANVKHHAELVLNNAKRRVLADCLEANARALREGTAKAGEVATRLRPALDALETRAASEEGFLLSDLYARPDLLRAPLELIPKMVWRQRVTLFAAREKAGKSTLSGYAAARASAGGMMFGRQLAPTRVLLISLEEHLGETVRRLAQFGANPDNVLIYPRLSNGLESLARIIRDFGPSSTYIDTLSSFVEGLVEDPNNPSTWTPIMNGISRIAREGDTGILVNHHSRKSDGKYRDSTAIGAGVDMILEMDEGEEGSRERKIRAKGRWQNDNFTIRLSTDGAFDLVSGSDAPLELRVLDYVRSHPGESKSSVRAGVGSKAAEVDAALGTLCERGLVINDADKSGRNRYSCPIFGPTGTGLGTTHPENTKSLQDKAGTGLGQPPPVPDPNPKGSGDRPMVWESEEELELLPPDPARAL